MTIARHIITVYETTWGSITKPGIGVPVGSEGENCAEGEDWVEGYVDDAFFYIDLATKVAFPRKNFEDEVVVTAHTVTGIPIGTIAYLYDTKVEVNDGMLAPTGLAETVQIRLWHPIYNLYPCEVVSTDA